MSRSSCMAGDMAVIRWRCDRRSGFERNGEPKSRRSDERRRWLRRDRPGGTAERRQAGSTCWWPAPAMSASPPPCRSAPRGPTSASPWSTPRPPGAWERDGRASAIAAAACRMLDQLGCWAEIAAAGAGDHRDDRHRFAHRRSGAAGVPHLRRRGRAGRAVRPYGRRTGRSTARCAAARPSSASTSSKASAVEAFSRRARRCDRPSRRRRDARRHGCWSPPTASSRGCATWPASRR